MEVRPDSLVSERRLTGSPAGDLHRTRAGDRHQRRGDRQRRREWGAAISTEPEPETGTNDGEIASDGRVGWGSGSLASRMKRRRVNDRVVVPVAVVAGLAAALGGASPTGTTWSDWLLIVASVALVTWAGASTAWWVGAALTGLAAAIAGDLALTVVGLAAFGVALWIGLQRRDLPVARAAVIGVGCNVLIRSELGGFLGLPTIVGVGTGAAIVVMGLRRRPAHIRHNVWIGVAATTAVLLVAAIGATIAAAASRGDLTAGNRLARSGLELLNDGDYLAAAERFAQAETAFGDADDALSAPWAQPAVLVPGLAQNLTAARRLASSATAASADVGAALALVDPEQLRLVNGRIDLDAIRLIQDPFRDVQDSIGDLEAAIDDTSSPWLIEPLQTRLDDLEVELADNGARLDNAVLAVDLAPQLLGADGPRRYFIAFTTPAEVRGHGGFMGNWAELSAIDGRLRLTEFGRTLDLNRVDGTRTVTGPEDWLEQWGSYGFTSGPGGTTEREPWSNITISPEFPSTAQVIAELYPQSGGDEIDGVFAMDPYVLQALLRLTGPISIAGSDIPLSDANVAQFLLVDQYDIDDSPTRVDLLDEVARATIDQVLGGALPNPTVVARELGPVAAQGRLAGWSRDPDEQQLFEQVNLAADLPDPAGGDGYAVVLNNAGANKLDVYLDRSITYDATVDPATGAVEATATITLTNTVDPDGLPSGVTGNYTGEPIGTNRTLLSLYTPLDVVDATVALDGDDPAPFTLDDGSEAGWNVASGFVAIPPGESVTVTVQLTGAVEQPTEPTFVVRPMPMVLPERHRIDVRSTDGTSLIAFDGVIDRTTQLAASPSDDG